jgi:hypothetical protein
MRVVSTVSTVSTVRNLVGAAPFAPSSRSRAALVHDGVVSGDDWPEDDAPPATGHDLHFLERLHERGEDMDVADLALRLYRDRGLVTALLGEERTAADRVAIALAEGASPPHAIVAREGAFVTCLGAGMSVGDRPVVPFGRVRVHVERADVLAERQARATDLWRDRAGVRALLQRCDDAGARLAREDFEQLAALAPILEGAYIARSLDAFARVRRAAPSCASSASRRRSSRSS